MHNKRFIMTIFDLFLEKEYAFLLMAPVEARSFIENNALHVEDVITKNVVSASFFTVAAHQTVEITTQDVKTNTLSDHSTAVIGTELGGLVRDESDTPVSLHPGQTMTVHDVQYTGTSSLHVPTDEQ